MCEQDRDSALAAFAVGQAIKTQENQEKRLEAYRTRSHAYLLLTVTTAGLLVAVGSSQLDDWTEARFTLVGLCTGLLFVAQAAISASITVGRTRGFRRVDAGDIVERWIEGTAVDRSKSLAEVQIIMAKDLGHDSNSIDQFLTALKHRLLVQQLLAYSIVGTIAVALAA